ncbi:GNAT family N-acetyltransferase [Isachenkonia alkalipeptolytica]|uniref:GNAT family N-acetyltransferase n=1 Tax=Isachenkonia alkalipeptolytica TaxID=2565777 RepID=A0AA44BEL6_9CLOT|nr:GNAT family N-acetyltransferase [Isachenkonia alkalipeptolytica]NBG87656.1 GNAT family N-acetyltransferase [Isachenkonia alkalipeptolytica]
MKQSGKETSRKENPADKEERPDREIEIVEFEEHHASSLADMWNASKEEWGGQDGNRTAAQVKSSIRNEGNIKDFVALSGDTVVGYCSFKEYEDDEGASYIPLLNVRPEYHGKKIGKKLLLKALEVAVEQGWPRMDLYTWSSNLKAVPLYKKCGFFWEKDNPHIHLMNFMPTVLNTEAITEYFTDLHWYDHVARELSVEPDGRVEKGFHFYEYLWKNQEETLRAEFCRRGRGLRLIETKDYKVACYTEQNEFPFKKSYPVYYRIINKTSEPLRVGIKGRSDKNIRYSYKETVDVQKEKTLEASFYVEAIEELVPENLTHPAITADLEINGKKAEFRLGIVPKFPLNLKFSIPEKECFPGKRTKGFIDLENGFEEAVEVRFSLVDREEIQWEDREVDLRLQGKEKKSLPVFFQVKKPGFYQGFTDIEVSLGKEKLTFQKEIKGFLRGRGGKFYGATEKGWSVVNGAYKLTLVKYENHITLEDLDRPSRDEIGYPKLGRPFGTDFSNKLPDEVTYESEEDRIRLRAVYTSENFPGLKLHSLSELFADGRLRQFYEVENTGGEDLQRALWVSSTLWHKISNATFSYHDEIIGLKGMEESRLSYFDARGFTENWSYAREGENSWGVVWPKDIIPEQEGPFIKINENLGKIPKGEKRNTRPVFMLYNTMKNWRELRRFALEEEPAVKDAEEPGKTFEVRVNEKNPFLRGRTAIEFLERKSTNLSGKITMESERGVLGPLEKNYREEEGLSEDVWEVDLQSAVEKPLAGEKPLGGKGSMDTLRITADLKKTRRVYHRQVFLTGETSIKKVAEASKLEKENLRSNQVTSGGTRYHVSNGLLGFSADPDFSNGLCSLTVNGKEVLDSSYPEYVSKFPWNPWAGGAYAVPEHYELETMLQQKRRGEFMVKTDNRGNSWEGLKVITEIQGIDRYKGLEIHQYYLTLPEIPVVCNFFEIHQKTGRYVEELVLENFFFFRMDENLGNTYFAEGKETGRKVEYKAGEYMVVHNALEKILEAGSRTAPQKALVYGPKAKNVVGFANKEMLVISTHHQYAGEHQSCKTLDPVFLIFSEDPVEIKGLEDLNRIRF